MLNTSEIIVSKTHIEPLAEDGYIIYKLGYISPVVDGKREARMIWGNVRNSHSPVSIDPASAAFASIDPATQVLTVNEQSGGGGGKTYHNSLDGIDGGDPDNNYFGHLSQAEYDKISKIPETIYSGWDGSDLLTMQVSTNLINISWYPTLVEASWHLLGEEDGVGIGQDMGKILIIIYNDYTNPPIMTWKHIIVPSSSRIGNINIELGDYNSLNMFVDFVGDGLPYKFIVQSTFLP